MSARFRAQSLMSQPDKQYKTVENPNNNQSEYDIEIGTPIKTALNVSQNQEYPSSQQRSNKFHSHLIDLKSQNGLYFNQIKEGKYIQQMQTNKPEVKYDYKKHNLTTNQQLYAKDNNAPIEIPEMYPIDYQPYKDNRMMELKSTNRTDWTQKTARDPYDEAAKVNRNTLQCGYRNLDALTTYHNQYIGKTQAEKVQNVQFPMLESTYVPQSLRYKIKTENQHRFQGVQQTNKDYFLNFAKEQERKFTSHVTGLNVSMNQETQYQRTHQNYQSNNERSFSHNKEDNRIKNTVVFEPIPVYDNQFLSVTRKDYSNQKSAVSNHEVIPKSNGLGLARKHYMYRGYRETQPFLN